jgi:hypothetical protein
VLVEPWNSAQGGGHWVDGNGRMNRRLGGGSYSRLPVPLQLEQRSSFDIPSYQTPVPPQERHSPARPLVEAGSSPEADSDGDVSHLRNLESKPGISTGPSNGFSSPFYGRHTAPRILSDAFGSGKRQGGESVMS